MDLKLKQQRNRTSENIALPATCRERKYMRRGQIRNFKCENLILLIKIMSKFFDS